MSTYRPSRLNYLGSAVCGGHATEEELIELGKLLEYDVNARRLYIKHLAVHAALSELGPLKLHASNTLGRDIAAGTKGRASLTPTIHWLYGLATMVLVSLLTWHLATRAGQGEVALMSKGGGASLNVSQLRIETGSLEMKLPRVGTLLVDGPARLELETPMRLRVDQGRVRMRVTEKTGYGFVVSTPHGDVTDLGTEFAVDVGDLGGANLVVFDGKVDLSIPRISGEPIIEHLVGGEGVRFARSGQLDRIMSIFTGTVETFVPSGQLSAGHSRVIANVSDNLSSNDTKRFYEIVPSGFAEDKVAYVDRPYEWNGVTKEGLPGYLVGGDYVRTFNDNKGLDFQLTVEVSRPCDLYVLWDRRVEAVPWLEGSFEKMEEIVGLDEFEADGRMLKDKHRGVGPGNSIGQEFLVWKRTVKQPGKVILGSLGIQVKKTAMYGVVVVGLGEVPAGPISPASIH